MHPPPRPYTLVVLCLSLALLSGCASESSIKPAESLDERTGMTVGSLEKPLELVQSGQLAINPEGHVSFAYLGPVEWDNMGTITYGLWVHLAPANDWQFDDIKEPGTVVLALDDGTTRLKVMQPPAPARGPYRPVASWGQTAYFELDLDTLKRMGSSRRIELDFKAAGTAVRFNAAPDARETLMRYVRARGY
ncbi:MAG: hypothetical protein ABSG30_17400 [Steroidobacteraceae bacterium]|jgi:hypothetical protein